MTIEFWLQLDGNNEENEGNRYGSGNSKVEFQEINDIIWIIILIYTRGVDWVRTFRSRAKKWAIKDLNAFEV